MIGYRLAAGIIMSATLLASSPAYSLPHLIVPLVEGVKHAFHALMHGGGSSAAVAVSTTTKTIALAAKSQAVNSQAVKLASVRTVSVSVPEGVAIGGLTVASASLAAWRGQLGLFSSGSDDVDRLFENDVVKAASLRLGEYTVVVCRTESGELYGVPSDTKRCLDGSIPEVLEQSASLHGLLPDE